MFDGAEILAVLTTAGETLCRAPPWNGLVLTLIAGVAAPVLKLAVWMFGVMLAGLKLLFPKVGVILPTPILFILPPACGVAVVGLGTNGFVPPPLPTGCRDGVSDAPFSELPVPGRSSRGATIVCRQSIPAIIAWRCWHHALAFSVCRCGRCVTITTEYHS